MSKFKWSKLNHLQIGKYAEYYVKMEFTLAGFDVYTAEVDDKGIDFIIRKDENTYYDIQVKSVRGFNYIFLLKEKFVLRKNLYAAIVIFYEGKPPQLYLIPSLVWTKPNGLFVSRDYKGKKSNPEWGINLAKKYLPQLEEYEFDKIINKI